MSKKISLGVTIALIFVTIATTVAITMAVSMGTYGKLINNLSARAERYDIIEELDEKVNQFYYGDIDASRLNREVAHGYIAGLGDENSRYMTAEEYVGYAARMQGKAPGIGIDGVRDPETGMIYIARVYDGSPAKSSGLQRGDRIAQVGGIDLTAENYGELYARLSGTKSTASVDIMYVRDGALKPASIPVADQMQTVFYENLSEIGYIQITAFFENTPSQLTEAINKLKDAGVKKLVIDLRDNAEGSLDYAVKALDLLVPMTDGESGALATTIDRNGNVVKTYASDAKDVALDMALLINSRTSGPAELFACDLRDFGKAVMIGETTKGRGTVDGLVQLKDGSAVVLTTTMVKPYKSESYDGVGLKPDYEVAQTDPTVPLLLLNQPDDAAYQKAMELFSDTKGAGPQANAAG